MLKNKITLAQSRKLVGFRVQLQRVKCPPRRKKYPPHPPPHHLNAQEGNLNIVIIFFPCEAGKRAGKGKGRAQTPAPSLLSRLL